MRASIKGECTCPTGLPLISSHNPLRSSSPLSCPGLHLGQQAPVDQLSSAARARAHASLTLAIDLHAAYRLCPKSLRSVEQAGGRALVNEPCWCRALKCVEKRGVFRLLPTHGSITGGHRRSMSYTVPFYAHYTKLLWFACCKERTERNK